MNKRLLLLTFFSASYLDSARLHAQTPPAGPAETSQSVIKAPQNPEQKNKVPGDIDQEITNPKLRADSGSKSKWSLSLSTNYAGASLEKPLDKDRPNPGQEVTPPRVSMAGSFAVRRRLNKNQSIFLGTGFQLQRPFQEARYGDVANPYVATNYVRRYGPVQNVLIGSASVTTNRDEVALGSIGAVGISNSLMYKVLDSKLSVGLAASVEHVLYQDNKDTQVRFANSTNYFRAGSRQRDWLLAISPTAEYFFSDKLQLRTVFRPWMYDHQVLRDNWTFRKRRWSQSLGVGWSVTRDVYLYPNIQFDWENWRADDYSWAAKRTRANSTVALSATINIF